MAADGVLRNSGFLVFHWESWVGFQSCECTVRILRLYVAFTSKLSLSLFLLAELVVQACVRVSCVCTEVIVVIEPVESGRWRWRGGE